MLRDEKSTVKTEEDLKEIKPEDRAPGEKCEKPVCATCDVHFLNPEDEIYRRILMAGMGFPTATSRPRCICVPRRKCSQSSTTWARTGPRRWWSPIPERSPDMCEPIAPVRPDKCPPVIENSDETLRKICYNRAHEMYGRTCRESCRPGWKGSLTSIISNGFAVMYIIAQKLVWKSNEDGYLVGSHEAPWVRPLWPPCPGITEVNPLSPHYYCTKCHYSDF